MEAQLNIALKRINSAEILDVHHNAIMISLILLISHLGTIKYFTVESSLLLI